MSPPDPDLDEAATAADSTFEDAESGTVLGCPKGPVTHVDPVTDTHWIEVVLLGEDDQPIPNARYAIELANGETVEGRLGKEGIARVSGLPPGSCRVTFPELDEDAWTCA